MLRHPLTIFLLILLLVVMNPSGVGADDSSPVTTLLPIALDGQSANGWSGWPSVSGDGRWVAFVSSADNLVLGDTNQVADIFVHDRHLNQTERISIAPDGTQSDGWSYRPAISADGRFVAYVSLATNLVENDTNGKADIFLFDRLDQITSRVSVNWNELQANGRSNWPSISGNGRYIAFSSSASNLTLDDSNQGDDVFVYDRVRGETRRIAHAHPSSRSSPGSGWETAISNDGRWIAFASTNHYVQKNTPAGDPGIILHDRVLGQNKTIAVSSASRPFNLSLSGDGLYLAFTTTEQNSGLLKDSSVQVNIYDQHLDQLHKVASQKSFGNTHLPHVTANLSADGRIITYTIASTWYAQDWKASATGQVITEISEDGQILGRPAISRDGSIMVLASQQALTTGRDAKLTAQLAIVQPDRKKVPGLTLSGKVTDPTGLSLIGVSVAIGNDHLTHSDRAGAFYFAGLDPGHYRVTPSKEGFSFTPDHQTITLATDIQDLHFFANAEEVVAEAKKDIGMPYSYHRGCNSPFIGCDGDFHGFHAGYCTDLVLDAFRWGVDFYLQYALERDALSHPDHFYRWRNARNAHDMWRYFSYTEQTLDDQQPYLPGDIVFFDWYEDGEVDHVAVVSQVGSSGFPDSVIDATGKIDSNPSGLTAELDWTTFHNKSLVGRARWRGSYGPIQSNTPPDLHVLQIAVDSPSVKAILWDENGRALRADHSHAFSPGEKQITGGSVHQLRTGIVFAVLSPAIESQSYLLQLDGQEQTPYTLQILYLVGGKVMQYNGPAQDTIDKYEGKTVMIQLDGDKGSFNLIGIETP